MIQPKTRMKIMAAVLAAMLPATSVLAADYRDREDGWQGRADYRDGVRGDARADVRDGGYAQAEVLSAVPQYETIRREVPQQICRDERIPRERARGSAAAPVLGAVIGGAIGNAVGSHKTNKRVGTVVGALLGGAIGLDVSRRDRERADDGYDYETRNVCREVSDYREDRQLTGYAVTYRFAGETYNTLMDHDPGRRLRVRVAVTPIDDDYNPAPPPRGPGRGRGW